MSWGPIKEKKDKWKFDGRSEGKVGGTHCIMVFTSITHQIVFIY